MSVSDVEENDSDPRPTAQHTWLGLRGLHSSYGPLENGPDRRPRWLLGGGDSMVLV